MGDASSPDLAHLDQRLAWARADLEQYRRLGDQVESQRRHLVTLRARMSRLQERVARERQDVDDLRGLNLAALVSRVCGAWDERHERELEEWLSARLRLEEARREHAAGEAQLAALERRLDSLSDPNPAYHELLAEKSRHLAEQGGEHEVRRLHLAERHGVLTDFLREVDEALWAGQVAKSSLTGLLHALSKAQALGRLDMFGLASSWLTFEHIDDAHRHASAANRALSRFQMELADVQARHDAHLTLELGGMAPFADGFMDDVVSDWVVQRRIDRSHTSAAIARTRVNRALAALTGRRHEVSNELNLIVERRDKLLGGDAPG